MDMEVDCESEMNLPCKELRVLLLHEFRLGRKAMEAARNICSTMGKDTHSQFVQYNIGSIGLRVVTSNSMIHDTLDDHWRWTSIF